MVINLIYIFTILIGLYFGIVAYITTKRTIVLVGLGILIFSLVLEIQWLNTGDYITYNMDVFWTIRDIIWTTIMIRRFAMLCKNKKKLPT